MRSRRTTTALGLLALLLLLVTGWWMLRPEPVRVIRVGEETAPDAATRTPDPLPPSVAPSPAAPGEGEAPIDGEAAEDAAPAATGRLDGTIRYVRLDMHGEPAADIHIVLVREVDGARTDVMETRSSEGGGFTFKNVPPGEYTFSTFTPGADEWDDEHETVVVGESRFLHPDLWVERVFHGTEGVLFEGSVRFSDGGVPEEFSFDVHTGLYRFHVKGRDGAFRHRIDAGGEVHIADVYVGEVSYGDLDETATAVEGIPFAIVLPAPRNVVLVAMDAATGAPIPGARAFERAEDDLFWTGQHGPTAGTLAGTPVVADEHGWIFLDDLTGPAEYYVIAEGHAWRHVELTGATTDEVPVRLVAGGSVRVRVPRWGELESAGLAVKVGEWNTWALPDPSDDGEVLVTGIPVGKRRFLVRHAAWWDAERVYGEADVVVRAGEESTVVIDVTPPGPVAAATVSGTLSVPSAWGLGKTRITFQGLDAATDTTAESVTVEVPSGGGAVPWTLEGIPAGRYGVTVEPQEYREVRIPAGASNLDLALPEPAPVRVRVLERLTGAPVPEPAIFWHSESEERTSYTFEHVSGGGEDGAVTFLVPPGRITVAAASQGWVVDRDDTDDFMDWGRSVDVPAGGLSLTVYMSRAGTVRIRLVCDGPAIDAEAFDISLEKRTESSMTGWGIALDGNVAEATEVAPGRYVVVVGVDEEVFRPVEERSVEVRSGQVTDVEVRILRK